MTNGKSDHGPVGEVLPNWLNDGERAVIAVGRLPEFASLNAQVEVFAIDDVETAWVATIPGVFDDHGSLTIEFEAGFELGRTAAIYVNAVSTHAGRVDFPEVRLSLINSEQPGATLEDLMAQVEDIRSAQDARYSAPLGTPAADAIEHRAVCLVEDLLTSTHLRFPGINTHPLEARLTEHERLTVVNETLLRAGSQTQITDEQWGTVTSGQHPMTAILMPQIWAPSMDDAYRTASDAVARVLTVLGVARQTRGQVISLIVEQRQSDDSIKFRGSGPTATYRGNLAIGQLAGEDQRSLLARYLTIDSDPLVRLCCDLYIEALAERSPDAQFFRFWSILETLSGARIAQGIPVTLSDGTNWPGNHGTTSAAAPRVYEYLRRHFATSQLHEQSAVAPAMSLYQAVRAWYGRRNAVGHYGAFVTTSAAQQAQPWYAWASQTATNEHDWIASLRGAVGRALAAELASMPPAL